MIEVKKLSKIQTESCRYILEKAWVLIMRAGYEFLGKCTPLLQAPEYPTSLGI